MLDAGIIRPSANSEYACEYTCAAKKDDSGDWTDLRFCNDFRPLNDCTPLDRYPLPHPDDIFNQLGDAKYFSKIDLRAGFNQIPVHPDSIAKTAFWCDGQKYEYTRMPFGLKNAPIYFQKVMDSEIERAGLRHCTKCFIDDVIIYSNSPEEHVQHVTQVLNMLDSCDLRFHPTKSVFMTESVEYLGHFVGPYGLSPAAAKVKAITDMPAPTSVEEVRAVMGLYQYYMRYVPHFAAIARPITNLTKKNTPFVWSDDCALAFAKLKSELTAPGRALKRPDFSKPFVLHTDFSNQGIAAVLTQHADNGDEHMVACISRSLNSHERVYSPYQGELLAVVWAVKSFHLYLHGSSFTLLTDHQPLQWLFSRKDLTGQSARWVLLLQEYEFTVTHRAGTANGNADALSRMPLDNADQAPMHPPLAAIPPRTGTMPDAVRMVSRAYESRAFPSPPASLNLPADLQPPSASLTPHHTFHTAASQHGLVIIDLCGGLATTLDAALRLGYHVKAHAYSDIDPNARWAAYHRVQQLTVTYPSQVPATLPHTFLTHLPQDLHDIHLPHFHNLLQPHPHSPVLFVCGWPCQDLSPAGPNTGLEGTRSSLIHTIKPLLTDLIRTHSTPVGYIFENAATQYNFNSTHVQHDVSAELTSLLGPPVIIDAAQCGSYAHRLRSYWTNLADTRPLGDVLHAIVPPKRSVQRILDPGRQVPLAQRTDKFPHYPVNIAGLPLRILPTLVSFPHSHSFRDGNQGMMVNPDGGLQQPTVSERERALGLPTGATAAPGLTDAQRHDLTGRVIDMHALTTLLHATAVVSTQDTQFSPSHVPVSAYSRVSSRTVSEYGPVLIATQPSPDFSFPFLQPTWPTPFTSSTTLPYKPPLPTPPPYSLHPVSFQLHNPAAPASVHLGGLVEPASPIHLSTTFNFSSSSSSHPAVAALLPSPQNDNTQPTVEELPDKHTSDIWSDAPVLHYLQSATIPSDTAQPEVARIKRRANGYEWRDSKLFRKLKGNESREVPHPDRRLALVSEMHHRTGHWGARRTAALLATQYWWSGMSSMAATVTAECPHCQRVKTSFNKQESHLRPLSIEGFCYRWSVDLAGPFQPVTAQGNQYVMIAIEHYSKHIEAVPLPNNQSATVAYAFVHNVLARFGSCAEVVTDNGSEFQGAFHSMLTDALIDHRFSSPMHPQANGLAERAVQTVKKALRKMSSERTPHATGGVHWDEQLPWVLLGYRASPQESSKFSPMQLLYARDPVIPPATVDRISDPLLLDDTQAATEQLLKRAEYLKQAGVVVDNNLRIAQHRDTLRYARVHGGAYLKKVFKFQEGDFVYVKLHHPTALEPRSSPYILRVIGVRPSGVLELVGRCGTVITRHSSSCAPCHLPNIDPTIDTQLARPIANLPCSVCGDPGCEHCMVLCDGCNSGWHLECLNPPPPLVFCPAW